MRAHLTLLLIGCVALSACRSKPKKKVAELPVAPPDVELSAKPPSQRSGAGGAPKVKLEGTKPTATEPAPTASRPKPEPAPIAAKPVAPLVPPPAPEPKPKEAPKAVAPPSAPVKAAATPLAPQPTVQRSVPTPPADAGKGSPTGALPPGNLPKPEPQPAALVPASAARPTKPADGRGLELNVPPKPPATAPVAEPLRATLPTSGAVQTKPATIGPMLGVLGAESRPRTGDSRTLTLPGGSGGPTNRPAPPPLGLQLGSGANSPSATNDILKPITVNPLLDDGKGGAAWREQQLAKQAAEQKAREEEQQKLKGALYRFLLKGGTNR